MASRHGRPSATSESRVTHGSRPRSRNLRHGSAFVQEHRAGAPPLPLQGSPPHQQQAIHTLPSRRATAQNVHAATSAYSWMPFCPASRGGRPSITIPRSGISGSTGRRPRRSSAAASAHTSSTAGMTSPPTKDVRFPRPIARRTPPRTQGLDGCARRGPIRSRSSRLRQISPASRKRNSRCHAPSRDLMKFPLHEWNQSADGGLVALTPFSEAMRWRAWRRQECCHSTRFSAGAPVPGPFPLYKQEVVVDVPGTTACVQPTVAYPRQS